MNRLHHFQKTISVLIGVIAFVDLFVCSGICKEKPYFVCVVVLLFLLTNCSNS
jgi:hypothetical protein